MSACVSISTFRKTSSPPCNARRARGRRHPYQRGQVSQEKGVHIAGLDRTDFLDASARDGVDAFLVDLSDLKRELER